MISQTIASYKEKLEWLQKNRTKNAIIIFEDILQKTQDKLYEIEE